MPRRMLIVTGPPDPGVVPTPIAPDPNEIRSGRGIDFLNDGGGGRLVDDHRLRRRNRSRYDRGRLGRGRRILGGRRGPLRRGRYRPMGTHPHPAVPLLRPIAGLPDRVGCRGPLPGAAPPDPAHSRSVPFPMAGDPGVVRTRGWRHHLGCGRLLHDHDAGRAGRIVEGKSEVEAETHAVESKRGRGGHGNEADDKKTLCVHDNADWLLTWYDATPKKRLQQPRPEAGRIPRPGRTDG